MNLRRSLATLGFCLAAFTSALAQFTLDLSPVSPGSAQLQFSRTAGYYYRLEKSTDLHSGFVEAGGWMVGDDSLVTWPIHYSVSPPSNGGSETTALSDTFTLFPFSNGKTLVTWVDVAGTRYSTLIVQNYSTLPPLLSLPGSTATATRSLMLLAGVLAWSSAYEALDPALLPQEQQTVLERLGKR